MCDALHEISDISDSAIADFFIDLASKSTNSDDLVNYSIFINTNQMNVILDRVTHTVLRC